VKGRTPVTQTSTKVTAAANTKEVVRYTSESVQIGPNILLMRMLLILRKILVAERLCGNAFKTK